MNELEIKENIKIENMIYNIRGKEIMIDSDLAELYQCKNGTKEINQAVKNNLEKFPERFCFRITEDEYSTLKSKFLTSKEKGGSRKGHNVFTEQGVAMLATVIKSKVAAEVSIAIMDAFVTMRKYISGSLLEQKYINNMVLDHDSEIKLLQESLDKLSSKEKNNHIFYEGQIYDAYNLLMNILEKAKNEIIIIDNYAGRELLNLIKNIKTKITIYSKNIDEVAVKKYLEEYTNIEIINNSNFHDRFIITDNKNLYHSGASFKDLGKKCFAITKIEDKEILGSILKIL